jgi:hypothetical protein
LLLLGKNKRRVMVPGRQPNHAQNSNDRKKPFGTRIRVLRGGGIRVLHRNSHRHDRLLSPNGRQMIGRTKSPVLGKVTS